MLYTAVHWQLGETSSCKFFFCCYQISGAALTASSELHSQSVIDYRPTSFLSWRQLPFIPEKWNPLKCCTRAALVVRRTSDPLDTVHGERAPGLLTMSGVNKQRKISSMFVSSSSILAPR